MWHWGQKIVMTIVDWINAMGFDLGYKHVFWKTSKTKGYLGFFISCGIKKLLDSLILFRIAESGNNFACSALSGLPGEKHF